MFRVRFYRVAPGRDHRTARPKPLRGLRLEALEDRTVPTDLSVIPLWDGETQDLSGLFMNRFGGNPVHFNALSHVSDAHTGQGAYRIDLNISAFNSDFVGLAFSGFGPQSTYVDTRDLTLYSETRFWLRNDTGAPFTLSFELKDYRAETPDGNDHRARLFLPIASAGGWQEYRVPLTLNPADGWVIDGSPDLSRAKIATFVFQADQGVAVTGPVLIDDLDLIEKGGSLDADTATLETIIARLADRQFDALWGSRDRNTGLMANISSFADVMATNVTSGLVQLLPGAVRRGKLSPAAADDYVYQVVGTYHAVLNNVQATGNGGFLPPRYIDRVLLTPTDAREESSVDAAFLYLALYQYRSLPTTPTALRATIDGLLARFDFSVFSTPSGWSRAYDYDTAGFEPGIYDGTPEIWPISLAAHLSTTHPVDIATHWNSGTNRTQVTLEGRTFVVHNSPDYRSPFLQWLLPLFLDTSNRGTDSPANPALATNPLRNALAYQRAANAFYTTAGRDLFRQRDAADDGTGGLTTYATTSPWHDAGQPDLFMPWSVAFAFLADPASPGPALRHHLNARLHGPFGLSDSTVWATGQPTPTRLPARNDLWNTMLSTLAFTLYSYGGNQTLAQVPAVRAALNIVLPPSTPPVLGGVPASTTYTENATLLIAPSATATDSDSPIFEHGTLTAALTAYAGANDRLSIRHQGFAAGQIGVSGTTVTFGSVPIGTFTGGIGTTPLVVTFNASATPARVQAVLRNVRYQLLFDNPTILTRTAKVTLTDGEGGTAAATQTITIVPVNDAPGLGGVAASRVYAENATLLLAPSGNASDIDSANFDTGKLTVALTANAGTNDRLSIRHQGYAAGQIGVNGSTVTFGSVPIGTVAGGVGTTPLTVTFNTSATPTRVQAVLRNVTYQLLFDNPTILTRTVRHTLTDGDGGTSSAVTQTVNIVPVNDAPTLGGIATSMAYTENATLLLAPNGTVRDADSANFDTGRLTVALTSNAGVNDRLAIRNQGTAAGQVGVNGINVTVGGMVIGTYAGGVGTAALVITFNANATPARVQAVLRNVRYQLLFDNPTILTRTVRYTLTDGDGGTSAAMNQTVTIAPVNDAPTLGGITGPKTYNALATPLLLAPSGTVADVDSPNFDGGKLTVRLAANGGSSDRLAIRHQGFAAGQIGASGSSITFGGVTIGTFSGGSAVASPLVVTFNANATVARVQAVLRNITYANISATPATNPRTVRFTLTDGDGGTSTAVDEVVNVVVP